MGAQFLCAFSKKLNESDVRKEFEGWQEQSSYESGFSYSGEWNMASGLQFEKRYIFQNRNQAEDWLAENTQKWENAIAVPVMDVEESDLVSSLERKISSKHLEITNLVRRRKDSLLQGNGNKRKCKNCESTIAIGFLKANGSDSCPVCKSPKFYLTPKQEITHDKILNDIMKLEKTAQSARDGGVALQDRSSYDGAVRWLIGALASC